MAENKREKTIVAKISADMDKRLRYFIDHSYSLIGFNLTISTFIEGAIRDKLKKLELTSKTDSGGKE